MVENFYTRLVGGGCDGAIEFVGSGIRFRCEGLLAICLGKGELGMGVNTLGCSVDRCLGMIVEVYSRERRE